MYVSIRKKGDEKLLFLLALETLADGERELIERLYNDYSKKVKKLSISILHSDLYSDDVVNDTFLKVIRYKEKFFDVSEDERIRLIIICARSICFNIHNRKKKIRFESLDSFYQDENENDVRLDLPADIDLLKILVEEETASYLQSAIDRLKSPAREMIILKFYHEMKNVEIAEFYKMNPSTVSTIIERSIKRLRRQLERYIYDTDN